RIAETGFGLDPLPRKQPTAERLAAKIYRALMDQLMRQLAADLGAKIRGEDGMTNAVAIVQERPAGAFEPKYTVSSAKPT
ncbi:MAG: hypothetical protein LH647_17860, partial [Leptolyngbyaceae cyanobacterium CAN_BIN12]|nr:hypothetical protein [Leptolyngbyaceae cyanobacterium CAN_BIN12]